MMKDMVAKHKGSMKEDVDALFNGESLSEEFRTKATTIFEAAVKEVISEELKRFEKAYSETLEEEIKEIQESLASDVDDYLGYVVENWITENEVAIESGLRNELTEEFMSGLRNLFLENYIDIPEDKINIVEELSSRYS